MMKDVDDVFVSAVWEARACAAPGEEASRAARRPRGQATLQTLPCQTGTKGANERKYLR
jgi:hypothetical protein